jgi:6-phosphogluconolactonase
MTMQTATTWVYIGTYTRTMPFVTGKAAGIAVCRLDGASGALTPVHTVTGVTNPSYLTIDPHCQALYCVEEHMFDTRESGEVSAFGIDRATGALTQLNRQPSQGAEPAHLSMDREGRWVLVANYHSGSIAVFPVNADHSLGPAAQVIQHTGHSVHPQRQRGPHAHWIGVDPANRFVLVVDLGLDAILTYQFDQERGTLQRRARSEIRVPDGAGPRHAIFRPDGRFLYLVNELDSSIISYHYDIEEGRLTPLQRLSTLPPGYRGNSTISAVRVAPNGQFVYASNRGHDSIAIFASDPATGLLDYRGYEATQGQTPRDFAIDPTGTFLFAANQNSNTIVTFRIDGHTGTLGATGQVAAVDTPVCIAFCPIAE